jgi:uncharacterized membrane protein YdjX (TVP38/TMEM64 family)
VRRASIVIAIACVLMAGAIYSYATSGLIYLLVHGSSSQSEWLAQVRDVVAGWGQWAPVIYTLAVIVEVVVAPIPGPLLYAPAGAIFGGLLGGTLSLIGNVAGAAIACALGRLIGDRIAPSLETKNAADSRFARYRERLQDRGFWVILLLRANPLTSSDLVSYAAGLAAVPIWKVAAGTLIGMAPLCYLQAYFAQRLFEVIPGSILIVSAIVLALALVLVLILNRGRSKSAAAA